MIRLFYVALFISCLIPGIGHSQGKYDRIDQVVAQLGAMPDKNVATIADTISRKFSDKQDKARAFYYWIANNIALDGKAIRSNDQKKINPEQVVMNRKTTSLGFAKLFQEMCSMGNIRCLVVDGYVKHSTEDINNRADEPNHSWNVVQLGKSPEEWYYVDVARGSGFLDKKQLQFTPSFVSGYFFPEKTLFNLEHFPDNEAWLLGAGPKGLKDFYALPVIGRGAYGLGLFKPNPVTGVIHTSIRNPVQFSFQFNGNEPIQSIELLIGEGNKQLKPAPMNFSNSGGSVNFSYQFKREDSYPVRIVVDGRDVLSYIVEATE